MPHIETTFPVSTTEVERALPSSVVTGSGAGALALDRRDQQALLHDRQHEVAFGGIKVKTGRGIVCFCLDDSHIQDYEILWPIAQPLNIPLTIAVYYNMVAKPGEGLTWANLKTMRDQGCEIACHSRTHTDPTTNGGLSNFIDETITVANELALAPLGTGENYNVDAFVQPGTWTGAYNFTTAASIDPPVAAVGQYFLSRYSLVTAYISEDENAASLYRVHNVPAYRRLGVGRSNDFTALTVAEAKKYVQKAEALGGMVCLYSHSFKINEAGWRTTAEVKELFEWIAGERNAGRIEIMSMTAAYHAQFDPNGRVNLISDGDFHLETPGTLGEGGEIPGWEATGKPTINAAAGLGGTNSLTIHTAEDVVRIFRAARPLRCVRVEFDARRAEAAVAAKARVIVRGINGEATHTNVEWTSGGGIGPKWAALTANWQTFAMQVTLDPRSDTFMLWPFYSAEGPVEYANFKVYKQ
jgi:peptidoglycan/xylan/chitin deacetylase (PgdA/CDA1 family)